MKRGFWLCLIKHQALYPVAVPSTEQNEHGLVKKL